MLRLIRRALLAVAAVFAVPAAAATTQVAVAANFTEPAKEIAAAFKQATGHDAVLSFGSSGAFLTQMMHGAPFEVFLSADADRPKKAEAQGIADIGSRFTYAVGRLALYSTDPALVDSVGAVLKRGHFSHIAIADPTAAPYGLAAVQVMQKLGLTDVLKPKLVTGNSITASYQYVATGAAELGFVALSQIINVQGGSRWIVPKTLHDPIIQQAVLLKVGADNQAARAFCKFLRGGTAKAIIKRYGYEIH